MASRPSIFNFLKEGALLPTHNRRLFAAVFVLAAASTSLLLLGNDLAVQPLADKLSLDAKALNGTDPGSPAFAHLVQEVQDDTRRLLLVGAAYLVSTVVVLTVVRVIVLFAAVTTYSGEPHTFGSLLGRAKAHLKGPLVTLAFVYALEVAYAALVAALAALLAFLVARGYRLLLLAEALVLLVAGLFLVYLSFVCSLSVVVAVAEPGRQGPGAVGRAWRLMKKGTMRRVVLFFFVVGTLAAVFSPVHALAKAFALRNVASGLLLGVVYTVLMAAVELFAVCAMTAFYYESKGSTEASATDYVQVPDQEQTNA